MATPNFLHDGVEIGVGWDPPSGASRTGERPEWADEGTYTTRCAELSLSATKMGGVLQGSRSGTPLINNCEQPKETLESNGYPPNRINKRQNNLQNSNHLIKFTELYKSLRFQQNSNNYNNDKRDNNIDNNDKDKNNNHEK